MEYQPSSAIRVAGTASLGYLCGPRCAPLPIPIARLQAGNSPCHYYLYGPLLGISWCVAAALDAAADGFASVLLTVNGAVLVRKIETHPFAHGLRADPTVDRAVIARNVVTNLREARLPPGTRLRFWSPTSIQNAVAEGADPARTTYWERNVEDAVFGGLAVRLFIPEVREVEFVRAFTPAGDSTLYAVYRLDGALGVTTSAALDSMLQVHGAAPAGMPEAPGVPAPGP